MKWVPVVHVNWNGGATETDKGDLARSAKPHPHQERFNWVASPQVLELTFELRLYMISIPSPSSEAVEEPSDQSGCTNMNKGSCSDRPAFKFT
jgi:hypothetical protein